MQFSNRKLLSPYKKKCGKKITYNISFWDACIVTAAEHANCDVILSEDLNTGQFYSGIATENPFT